MLASEVPHILEPSGRWMLSELANVLNPASWLSITTRHQDMAMPFVTYPA